VTTPESLIYNLGANLTAPLLNRQGIKADYLSANAEQLKAVFNYERTLLRAFTEVANQLSNLDNLQQSYTLESKQVEMLNQAIEVSNILFQSARADYMEVLLTRRDALESQMELIETRLRQKRAMVNVYQALGGGWR
jgi:outer membrane protein TolC